MTAYLAALALIFVASTARGQSVDTLDSTRDTSARSSTIASRQPLRPGDLVRLKVWREPDISGDYQVDERGLATFPMLGAKRVTNLIGTQLRDTLLAGYGRYLKNPSITVVLLRRVNVFGAVRNPGLYPVDPTMALGDVLAAAGGATPQGVPDEVRLVRAGVTISGKLSLETRLADLPLQSGDQVIVPERSWITQNSGLVAAALTASVSLIIALLNHR